MKIIVRITKSYGKWRIYPVCEKAKLFARIAARTCLTKALIDDIKALGYAVEVATETQVI